MNSSANKKTNKTHKFERIIKRTLIILLFLLVFIQYFNMHNNSSFFLNPIKILEGSAMSETGTISKNGSIQFTFNKSDIETINMSLYINGELYKKTSNKTIDIPVKNHDIIEISKDKASAPVKVTVTKASENLAVPELGKTFYIKEKLTNICRISFK